MLEEYLRLSMRKLFRSGHTPGQQNQREIFVQEVYQQVLWGMNARRGVEKTAGQREELGC